ncbi:MAG: hypothetical protein JJE25_03940, partial [Bacteroidia bacterium]|nr:hypothetical protein [Bacteroidia bacterium]
MKKITLLFIAIVFWVNGFAQSNLFKKIVYPAYAAVAQSGVRKMVKTADNGYVFVGNCAYGTLCGLGAALFKFDSTGTMLWNFSLNTNNENMFDAIATPDSGIIAVGSALFSFPPTNIALLVVKVNPTGNIIWSRVDTLVNFSQYGFSIVPSSDGNYIVQAGTQMVIYKISPSGSLLWYSSHNLFNALIGLCAVNGSNGNITDLLRLSSGNDAVAVVNSSGGITQVRSIVSTPAGFKANHISGTNDNGFLITGNYGFDGNLSGWSCDTAALIKTDSSFTVQWAKLYVQDNFIITGAQQAGNSDIIVSASRVDTSSLVARHFILMKTDASGNILQAIENINESFAADVNIVDGHIFVSGGYGDDSSPNDFLVIKTDATFSNLCGHPISISQISFNASLVPYPPFTPNSWNAIWQSFSLNPIYSSVAIDECIPTYVNNETAY